MRDGRVSALRLLTSARSVHSASMFVVSEAEAAEIRAVFDRSGEVSAVADQRWQFPAVADNTQAR
jgi:hypothetical protein